MSRFLKNSAERHFIANIFIIMPLIISISSAFAIKQDILPSDITIKEAVNANKVPGINATFRIKGKIDEVWKFIHSVKYLKKLFPAVKKITRVRKISPDKTLWEYQLKSALGLEILIVNRMVDNKNYSVKWNRVTGDLKSYVGSWELKTSDKHPGWVECSFTSFIKHSKWVPGELVLSINKDNVEAMVTELRKLIEKSNKSKVVNR